MAPTKSEKPSKGWNDKFKTIGQWLKTIGKIALGIFLFVVLKEMFISEGRDSRKYVSLKDKKNDIVGGCIFNDCKNGDGIYAWENGDVYKGEFNEDGNEHGQGTFIWANGTKYVGEWKDGNEHGQGTQTVIVTGGSDLSTITGQWKEGIPYGILVMKYPSGGKYVGEWRIINEGDFDTFYRDGRGMHTFSSGSPNIGLWIKGKLDQTLTKHEVTSYLEKKYPDQFKLEMFK